MGTPRASDSPRDSEYGLADWQLQPQAHSQPWDTPSEEWNSVCKQLSKLQTEVALLKNERAVGPGTALSVVLSAKQRRLLTLELFGHLCEGRVRLGELQMRRYADMCGFD